MMGKDAQDIAWHQCQPGLYQVPVVSHFIVTKPDETTQKYLDAMREINQAHEDRLRQHMGKPIWGK